MLDMIIFVFGNSNSSLSLTEYLEVGDKKLLLVSLYPEMARAFNRVVDGMILEFEYVDDKIIDTQTNSQWNLEGEAIEGQLIGKKLEREVFNPGFWFEWIAFHPDSLVY